jgi:uncharacterized protein (DUF2225 family)
MHDFKQRKKALASVIMENIAQTTSSKEYDQDSELFWHPNVIDVKLGTKLSSDSEESEKKDRKETTSKNTTSGKFAMRLSGAEVCCILHHCCFFYFSCRLRSYA